jgi:hypothetical protein
LIKYLIPLAITGTLFAQENIHSSLETYIQTMQFTNSVQKEDAMVYGILADIHHERSEYKVAYELGQTNTKQPPLKEDLRTDKLFAKYNHSFENGFEANLNYINILNDNIAITNGGKTFGAGVSYNFNKQFKANITQFLTHYDDFEIAQSDLTLSFKTELNNIHFKLTSLTKYININEKNANTFTKNADENYLTSGVKLHAHYESYHMGVGAYFGKRVFAIMDDGFKIQHHSMEFDCTYALGVGKNIGDYVFRLQYLYQRATELPVLNENVEISNLRIIANYKF